MSAENRLRVNRESRERRQRRITSISLLVSIAIHLLLLWTTGRLGIRATPFTVPPVVTTPAPEGLVVVDVAPSSLEDESDDPRPEPQQPQAETAPRPLEVVDLSEAEIAGAPAVPSVDPPAGRPVESDDPSLTNAERLTTRFVDGRIWFDPRNPFLFGDRLERFARADSAVRAILRDWLDSLSLDEDARQRARDWTFEKDGKRWGISPEGLHLGDITIPIPFGFAPSGPRRREFEQAIRDLTEIQLQDLRADLKEVEDERRRAMEKRRAEEIFRRRGDTTTVRPPPFDAEPRGPP